MMKIIEDKELQPLIQPYLRDFVSISNLLVDLSPEEIPRPLIGRLLLEAGKSEEMLDAYGAKRNKTWLPVRIAVATAKAFSRIIYKLFHIHLSHTNYKLLPVEGDFPHATQEVLNHFLSALSSYSESFMEIAKTLEIDSNLNSMNDYNFYDFPAVGHLATNIAMTEIQDPKAIVIYLASKLLNVAEKSHCLDSYKVHDASNYHECIPNIISEEHVRFLSNNFHTLQSMYDTHILGTHIAEKENRLSILRGNITVIYHLLSTGLTVTHFYERHTHKNWIKELKNPLPNNIMLEIFFEYFIAYAEKHLRETQKLCRLLIKSYAVQGSIKVPIPNYRGFHVRPSRLIARIVAHYGSEVKMILGEGEYNAADPLELIRANEEINRRKRNSALRYIMENNIVDDRSCSSCDAKTFQNILRTIFFELLKTNKILMYQTDFLFEDVKCNKEDTLAEHVKRIITRYMAEGKLDIMSDEVVSFLGDMRVLEDIKTLANHGYGEDALGHNIPLPSTLEYLRRSSLNDMW